MRSVRQEGPTPIFVINAQAGKVQAKHNFDAHRPSRSQDSGRYLAMGGAGIAASAVGQRFIIQIDCHLGDVRPRRFVEIRPRLPDQFCVPLRRRFYRHGSHLSPHKAAILGAGEKLCIVDVTKANLDREAGGPKAEQTPSRDKAKPLDRKRRQ
jgi:hypothetical protein